jgi:parallel beta-helix repeat protein
MKNNNFQKCLLVLTVLSFLTLNSCNKSDSLKPENQSLNGLNKDLTAAKVDEVKLNDEMNVLLSKNEARLAASKALGTRELVLTANVPKDYPTIQAAVDAVSPDGDVIVKTGTYTETVVVSKPGIHIKAIGDVTVKGGFVLNADADFVKIQKFKIVVSGGNGIRGRDVTGVQVLQNTVSGTGNNGIVFINSTDVSISNNTVSGINWGILLLENGVKCNNNSISQNTITSMSFASPIHLQGDCDNNFINGNTATLQTGIFNAGIILLGLSPSRLCDNNSISNNVCESNRTSGIWLLGGTENTVGPNNTFSKNTEHGIYLSNGASNNNIFNNTALQNVLCDIKNDGANDNVFKNNTADCNQGF